MQEFGASGIAAPVDQYLKTSRVVKQADIWPTLLYDLTWKGQQYGMPFGPDIAVMWVQAGFLRSVGLDPTSRRRPGTSWSSTPAGCTGPTRLAWATTPSRGPAARGRCSCWPSPSSAASC